MYSLVDLMINSMELFLQSVVAKSRNLPHSVEPEDSLPCSQELAT
jgi:hypothetical protein